MRSWEGREEGKDGRGTIGKGGSCQNARRIWASPPQIADFRGFYGFSRILGVLAVFDRKMRVGKSGGFRAQTNSFCDKAVRGRW